MHFPVDDCPVVLVPSSAAIAIYDYLFSMITSKNNKTGGAEVPDCPPHHSSGRQAPTPLQLDGHRHGFVWSLDGTARPSTINRRG